MKIIQLIVLGAAIFFVVRYLLGRQAAGAKTRFKCATCIHCRRLDEDGSICGYGDRETYKNPVHIANCMDYETK